MKKQTVPTNLAAYEIDGWEEDEILQELCRTHRVNERG
jgi:hypothetical protein